MRASRSLRVAVAFALLTITATVLFAVPDILVYRRAASLLQRVADPNDGSALARYDVHPVKISAIFEVNGLRARTYTPVDLPDAPALVLLHGVHHLGIDEPRLVAFAKELSASGIMVLTPELRDLADYHIVEESVTQIGNVARYLKQRTNSKKVGVMGLSFAGGLSLVAASDPRFRDDIGYVVSVGGHADLARVCRFLATDEIPRPDGTVQRLAAHEYGALVVIYAYPDEFFSPADVPVAREALRLLLWEKVPEAQALAAKLSPAGRARMQLLFDHQKSTLRDELLASIQQDTPRMPSVSPSYHLQSIRASVLLLHGQGDTVIPAVETEWLTKQVPSENLRGSLITGLLTHVDVGAKPPLKDELALLHFMAQMLSEVDRHRPMPQLARLP